jgi:predicted ATPase
MFQLSLNNYRSIRNENFKFSKVNILIGENSSGKSSVLKFFLALKQTLQSPYNREFNLAFSGGETDLGNYNESVYYHKNSLDLDFGFDFGNDYYEYFIAFLQNFDKALYKKFKSNKLFVRKVKNNSVKISFSINKNLNKHGSINAQILSEKNYLLKFSFSDSNEFSNKELLFSEVCDIKLEDFISKQEYIFTGVEYSKEGFLTMIDGPSLEKSIKAKISDETLAEEIFLAIVYLLVAQNRLRNIIEKVSYINPTAIKPERVYLNRDLKASLNINTVEDVVNFLKIDANGSLKAEFINILREFGIADDIILNQDKRLPVSELKVKIKDLTSNIMDVGYGVSLQLPIILKALLTERLISRNNSILLIEQPEVHLHPKLQAKFIEIVMSLSKQTTYIIETHSEHIVRKLQVLVKQGKYGIKPEDVSIHYFRRENKKTIISSHLILEDGFLEPEMPNDFFDLSYNLVKELFR